MSEEKEIKKDNKTDQKAKKLIWKKWWIWLIIILAIAILGGNSERLLDLEQNNNEKQVTQSQEEVKSTTVEECRDGLCKKVWKIEEMNSEKDYIKELENFIANPSVTRLEGICEKAKDIKTAKTREVLSNDRTEMVRKQLSLWEVLSACEKVEDENFTFKGKEERDAILAKFKESDINEVRKRKIQFNEKMEELLENQKIFGYNTETAKFINCSLENSCEGEMKGVASEFGDFMQPDFDGIVLPIKEVKRFLEEYKSVEN